MINQIAEWVFVVGGSIAAVLLVIRIRRVSSGDASAAATAVFGLFLCSRYAELIQTGANWPFDIAVAFMMALLAYRSLGFDHQSARQEMDENVNRVRSA